MGRDYIDGGLKFNNPASVAYDEGRLIAANHFNYSIDVVFSIGTARSSEIESDNDGDSTTSSLPTTIRRRRWWRSTYKLVKHQFDVNLETERAWHDFLKENPSQTTRFHRINPELDYKLPLLDDVNLMYKLQMTTRSMMAKEPSINSLACELIASSFYFQKSSHQYAQDGAFVCPGRCLFALSKKPT